MGKVPTASDCPQLCLRGDLVLDIHPLSFVDTRWPFQKTQAPDIPDAVCGWERWQDIGEQSPGRKSHWSLTCYHLNLLISGEDFEEKREVSRSQCDAGPGTLMGSRARKGLAFSAVAVGAVATGTCGLCSWPGPRLPARSPRACLPLLGQTLYGSPVPNSHPRPGYEACRRSSFSQTLLCASLHLGVLVKWRFLSSNSRY